MKLVHKPVADETIIVETGKCWGGFKFNNDAYHTNWHFGQYI